MAANNYGWAAPNYGPDPYQRPQYDPSSDPWGGANRSSKDFWYDSKTGPAYTAYRQNVEIPDRDFYLQDAAQRYQEYADQRNYGEQARMNREQYELAMRGSGREDRSLANTERWNERDFGENRRRFDSEYGLARDRYGLDRERYGLDRELGMGRLGLDRDVGMGRLGLDREMGLGQLRQGDRRLEMEDRLAQERLGIDRGQLGLGRDSLSLERQLGTGRLGLDTRRFEADDRFRYQDLEQQANLTRERLANEMTQSRYAAFGRRSAPNFNAMNAWR